MDCVIVASGDMDYSDDFKQITKSADLLICADGGFRHLKAMNMLPHVVIGDFDSIDESGLYFLKQSKTKMVAYPENKDFTDTHLCFLYAFENHASSITLFGGSGSRLDHTLANIFLLKQAADIGIKARMLDKNNEIFFITDSTEIKGEKGDLLSIIPAAAKVEGVHLKGLAYPLDNAEMKMGSSLGISNVFKDETAVISIKSGAMIVTKSTDRPRPVIF